MQRMEAAAARIEVEVWSDVVCPWCWVGKRRFEAALARFDRRADVRLTWRAFELDPAAPRSYDGQGTYAERLSRKYRSSVRDAEAMIERMTSVAQAEGLTFDFDRARPGNTFDAHRLLHAAAASGQQDRLKERLFRATFTEGEPIGDPETLVRLGAEVGLDEERARAVVLSDEGATEVRAEEARAHALGISGVPCFVVDGKYAVSGAQSPEVILAMLERASRERPRPALEEVGAEGGAVCDADGCS